MPNTKQLTAMQSYIDELQALKDIALQDAIDARNSNEPTEGVDAINVTYSIAIKMAKDKLATERQQLIDFHIECMKHWLDADGSDWKEHYLPKITEIANTEYNNTFKPNK